MEAWQAPLPSVVKSCATERGKGSQNPACPTIRRPGLDALLLCDVDGRFMQQSGHV